MLTGHNFHGKFYGYINTGVAPASGSCCADTMRIWDKSTGDYTDVDLVTPMETVFPESTYDYATHQFEVSEYNGEIVAFCMAQFYIPELNNAPSDVIVAISMETGKIVPTAAGKNYFNLFEEVGTRSSASEDSIFKIFFYNESGSGNPEEFHGNGIARFITTDGTPILAITHKNLCEAILMTDPWTLASGGEIVQRFGTPHTTQTVKHSFGVSKGEIFTGVHNVYYGLAKDGRESVTMFINGQDDSDYSWVYEFDVKLTYEANVTTYSDDVFATSYRGQAANFQTDTQGGARPIGPMTNGSGVWLIASGSGHVGLVAVDQAGGATSYASAISYYDPFTYIRPSSTMAVAEAPPLAIM